MVGVGERVRDRVDRVKNGITDADYLIRRMLIEYLRFNAVGVLNVAFFFALNYVLDRLDLSAYKSLAVWAPAWIIGAVQAHAAHRWITFRSRAAYRESLFWATVVYGVTAFFSTLSVFLLADVAGVNYWIVWAMNTIAFGFASFLGLRGLAFPPSQDADKAGPRSVAMEDVE